MHIIGERNFMHRFRILNSNFETINFLSAVNIQWRRKYYEVGDFEIQQTREQYNNNAFYIWNTENNEMGIIQKKQYKEEGHGVFVYLSGSFIECCLNWNFVWNDVTLNRDTSLICRDIISKRIASKSEGIGLEKLKLGTYVLTGKTQTAWESSETKCGTVCQKWLQEAECGHKIRYDLNTDAFYYDIYKGKDLTGNNAVIFSEALKNINDWNCSNDISNYYNYAWSNVTRKNNPDTFIQVDYKTAGEGENLRKIRKDITDTEGTDTEAIARVKDQLKLELLNHTVERDFTFKPVSTMIKYKTDYDLGDKIIFQLDITKEAYNSRITEVNEVYKKNNWEYTLTLGNKRRQDYITRRI